jgi:hypothetical protein
MKEEAITHLRAAQLKAEVVMEHLSKAWKVADEAKDRDLDMKIIRILDNLDVIDRAIENLCS